MIFRRGFGGACFGPLLLPQGPSSIHDKTSGVGHGPQNRIRIPAGGQLPPRGLGFRFRNFHFQARWSIYAHLRFGRRIGFVARRTFGIGFLLRKTMLIFRIFLCRCCSKKGLSAYTGRRKYPGRKKFSTGEEETGPRAPHINREGSSHWVVEAFLGDGGAKRGRVQAASRAHSKTGGNFPGRSACEKIPRGPAGGHVYLYGNKNSAPRKFAARALRSGLRVHPKRFLIKKRPTLAIKKMATRTRDRDKKIWVFFEPGGSRGRVSLRGSGQGGQGEGGKDEGLDAVGFGGGPPGYLKRRGFQDQGPSASETIRDFGDHFDLPLWQAKGPAGGRRKRMNRAKKKRTWAAFFRRARSKNGGGEPFP